MYAYFQKDNILGYCILFPTFTILLCLFYYSVSKCKYFGRFQLLLHGMTIQMTTDFLVLIFKEISKRRNTVYGSNCYLPNYHLVDTSLSPLRWVRFANKKNQPLSSLRSLSIMPMPCHTSFGLRPQASQCGSIYMSSLHSLSRSKYNLQHCFRPSASGLPVWLTGSCVPSVAHSSLCSLSRLKHNSCRGLSGLVLGLIGVLITNLLSEP